MRVAVDLHVHTQQDADSRTPPQKMARVARQRMGAFTLLGFVGHDLHPDADPDGILSVTGVEHERRREPTRLHLIEYPDHDLTILAHPRLTWPENTGAHVVAWLNDNPNVDVDAVEQFTGGRRQYSGHLPDLVEIAGSDAHSPLMLGSSFIATGVNEVSTDAVMRAVKAGRVEPIVNRPPWHRRWLARTEKALSLALADPSAAARVGRQHLRLKNPPNK